MEYTYQDLKHKTVAELREIASGIEHEAVQGYTQMNKDHLIKAICTALKIDMHEHHVARLPEKTEIKKRIRALKKERDQAIADHDYDRLKRVRKEIKALKKKLRRAMV